MAAYDALLVQKVEATSTTDDGQHMLLKLKMAIVIEGASEGPTSATVTLVAASRGVWS